MSKSLITRFLTVDDIPALQRLEARQWDSQQAASDHALRFRIEKHRDLCVGAFCSYTGELLASLFMRQTLATDVERAKSWDECAADFNSGLPASSNTLFGISFTSTNSMAAMAIFQFFWPYALKNGWARIYLGSPVPGLRRALTQNPQMSVETYARSIRGRAPHDRQLRYYYQKGFRKLVAVVPNYFPHESSLNYGVLLQGEVPLASFRPLWVLLPIGAIQRITQLFGRVQPISELIRTKAARLATKLVTP